LVEIIVIGVMAVAWLIPVVRMILAPDTIDRLQFGGLSQMLYTLPVLYLVGALVNFASDRCLAFLDLRVARRYGGKDAYRRARAVILLRHRQAAAYMQERRSLVRIFRASVFNLGLTLLVVAFDIGGVRSELGLDLPASLAFLIVLASLAFWAHSRTLSGYYAFLHQVGGLSDEEQRSPRAD
jgi:hypothetical protein